MKTLKFNKEYDKMLENKWEKPPQRAILMEVFLVDSEALHPRFVEYDTLYFDEEKNNWAYYTLPAGKVIVLLLRTDFHEPMIWTTIRRYTPKKWEYYKKARWEEFRIEIQDGGEKEISGKPGAKQDKKICKELEEMERKSKKRREIVKKIKRLKLKLKDYL